MVAALSLVTAGRAARADRDVSILDVIELDMGYTTIADQYYRSIAPQRILDGARTGIAAYLRSRGISDPNVAVLRARRDGRGVVPAIEHLVGTAIERYGDRVDSRDLVHAAIRGELGELHDPYSVFFSKRDLAGFTNALDGITFGGIGVLLADDSTGTNRADTVFDGGPAARAGIMAGDVLVSVDGKPLAGLSSAAISALLRGRSGTVVRVEVRSAGAGQTRIVAITRAPVTPPDVTARLLPSDIGYIALRVFGPSAGDQVRTALDRLRADGARAIVFDLRGNGGGYESSAVKVASVFIAGGPIVVTQANHGHRNVIAADGTALPPLPLAVLVDGDSASGSELVTGAIADHHAGTIVGERTFGKGLVQSMFPLPDGSAMKLTTAHYFTPAGRDIDRVGIEPDVVVAEPVGAIRGQPGQDPQLDAAIAALARGSAATPAPPATYR